VFPAPEVSQEASGIQNDFQARESVGFWHRIDVFLGLFFAQEKFLHKHAISQTISFEQ
jgi:hypothetical protein